MTPSDVDENYTATVQLIKDALDSAVEDEYFEITTKEDGTIWYTPIIYDEYD